MLVIVQERFDGLKLGKINLIANEFVVDLWGDEQGAGVAKKVGLREQLAGRLNR